MNKTKFLTVAIVLLFIINIGTLVFFSAKGRKEGREKREPKEIIIEKLHLNEDQIDDYQKLINEHRKTINSLDNTIKNLKRELYSQLSTSENKVVTDSLFNAIANKQLEIEKVHYNHFLDIKKLCKEDQLKDFEKLTYELAKIFSNRPPKK